jgi:hypothetical protein
MRIMLGVLFILISYLAMAQDEKVFRELLTHKAIKDFEEGGEPEYAFQARGHRYYIDLDEDKIPESFFVSKRDGVDWIDFFNSKGEKFFDFQFDTLGSWSRVFKVQLRKVSQNTKLLLIYFHEGVTRYVDFRGTARVYFLTWEENNLKTMSMYKGPYIWDENRTYKNHYHQRKSEVSLYDFDEDFQREVAVRYGSITRVYKYSGKGNWKTYDLN